MGLFRWLWNGLRQLVGLVLPVFARARDFATLSPGARVALHVLVLVIILVGLTVLQNSLPGLRLNIRSPFLAPVWLPVLFLLLYALVWLVWWLWRVLFSEESSSAFADIDAAWAEARRALQAADIDLQAVPLFLVLGRPAAGESSLFQAARLPFLLKQVPHPDAPLQIWANRQDGIFVACVDAGRLSARANLLALTAGLAPPGAARGPDEDVATGTIGGATIGSGMEGIVGGLMDAQLPEEERRRRYKALEGADRPEEARRLTERLEHLCRLVTRDRWPEPPVNGVLVLIPHAATQSRPAAEATTRDCQQDLESVGKLFRLHCPLFALVCDLETAPGFPAFLEAHLGRYRTEEEKRRERKRRLGRRLGWGVGLDPAERRRMVEEQVQWIGRGMFPNQIYKGLFRVEKPGREDASAVVRHNYQVSRFMAAHHEGQRRLTGIILNGLLSKPDGPDLLGGCYLAATGRDADREQAFVAGVFERLLEAISSISWSAAALHEEAQYQRWTRYGYLALPVFVVFVALLLILWWRPLG